MIDWIFDRAGWIVSFIFFGFVALLIYGAIVTKKERYRLISQCLNDGRKEYECRAMFQVNRRTTFVPTVINR